MKKIILIFSIFVIVLQGFAIDMDEIINETIEKYENLNSFYAEFNQIMCDEVSGTCSSFKGKIYFMKPNFFRMEMENPKQIYVGDSVSLWIYLPEKNRAIRQSLSQMPFQISPDIFLKDYEERFNAELTDEEKNSVQITLIPKDQTDIYEKIIIKILKGKFEIVAITIIDEIGSESKFNFEKIEINKKISKKLFKFNPPKGTQIDEY